MDNDFTELIVENKGEPNRELNTAGNTSSAGAGVGAGGGMDAAVAVDVKAASSRSIQVAEDAGGDSIGIQRPVPVAQSWWRGVVGGRVGEWTRGLGWVVQLVLFAVLLTVFFNKQPLAPLVEGMNGVSWVGGGRNSAMPYLPPLKIGLILLPVIFLALLLNYTFKASRDRSASGKNRWSVIIPLLMALAGTAFSAAVQVMVLDRIPHVQDSINYLWQARVFADGMISVPSHPLAEFFSFRFMVNDGNWYSLFQPGWPAILAIGVLAGAPWLVNPIIGGLTVMMVYLIGRRVFGYKTGVLASVLLAISPFFLFMNSSMMAHPAGALLASVAVWSWLTGSRYMEIIFSGHGHAVETSGAGRRLVFFFLVCGLSLGGLFLVRAMDGALIALIIGFHGVWLWLSNREYRWLRLLFLMVVPVAAILTGSLQFAYNQIQTGDPMVWPQDVYFGLTEPVPDCHRPGFGQGIGCPREHGPDLAGQEFTPALAAKVTSIRLADLSRKLWGGGLGVVLFLAGILVPLGVGRGRLNQPGLADGGSSAGVDGGGRAGRPGRAGKIGRLGAHEPGSLAVSGNPDEILLIWAWALIPVAGYFFYYYHGNCFGPRYYFTGLPAMALMAGSAITVGWHSVRRRIKPLSVSEPAESMPDNSKKTGRSSAGSKVRTWALLLLSAMLVSFVAGLMLHNVGYAVPAFWREVSGVRGWGYWGVDRRIETLVTEQELKNSVVIIPVGSNPDKDDSVYRFGFVSMDHDPDNRDVVVVRDHGSEHNRQLFQYYQERDFYRYTYRGGTKGRLIPLSNREMKFDPNVLHVEAESKFPVSNHNGHAKPVKPGEQQMFMQAGRGHVLEFTCADGKGEGWFSFNQHIFEAGEYQVEAGFVTGTDMGVATLAINDIPMVGEMNGQDQYNSLSSWRSGNTIALPSGMIKIAIQINGGSSTGDECKFALDYIRFRKVTDAQATDTATSSTAELQE